MAQAPAQAITGGPLPPELDDAQRRLRRAYLLLLLLLGLPVLAASSYLLALRFELAWVATPTMAALPRHWAEPLRAAGRLHLDTHVLRLARDTLDGTRWQLHAEGGADDHAVHAGFDQVLLALPAPILRHMLSISEQTEPLAEALAGVDIAPCWTLMLAFPHAAQPGLHTLGPQWNAARSTHHRIAWLARESSKPRRGPIERWTAQASAAWSREHENDDTPRATAKLLKAFAEVTGIRATPAHAEALLWRQAKTLQPLGRPFVWDAALGVGLCGDWCLGHRVEDAFVSGLELALTVAARGVSGVQRLREPHAKRPTLDLPHDHRTLRPVPDRPAA